MGNESGPRADAGFGLVDLLMAAGLLSLVSLGTATVMNNLQLSQNSVESRTNADTVNAEMRANLSSVAACTNSFGGMVVGAGTSAPITKVFDGSSAPGKVAYQAGLIYGDGTVTLQSMTLGQYQAGPATQARITLSTNFSTAKAALGPTALAPRTINIGATLAANGAIQSCLAQADMSDGIWQRSATNIDNIYFTDALSGQVGIGRDPITALLDVAGDVRAASAQQPYMPVSLVPNTASNNSGFWQGVAFNLEYQRTAENWRSGGDGVNSGAGALLMNHNDGILRFLSIPTSPWSWGNTYTSNQLFNYTQMVLTPTGHLGIGTTSPTYQLQLSTDSAAKPGTGSWAVASDRRLKDVRELYGRGLGDVEKLRPVIYNYRSGNALHLPAGVPYVGVVAQAVQDAIPEAVTSDERGYLHVTNDAVMWAMVNAIQDLSRQNRRLQARLDALDRASDPAGAR